MLSLRDVLPAGKKTVVLRTSRPESEQIKVDIRGIDVADFGALFSAFPEIYDALNGSRNASGFVKALSTRGIVALIAAGAECLGDEQAEAGIANLTLFDKMALLAAIVELTIPDGDTGPFLALVRAFGLKADAGPAGIAQQKAA